MKNLFNIALIILVTFLGLAFLPKIASVSASTMLIDPAFGTIEAGKDLSVKVIVQGTGEQIDGVDANIAYDVNVLKVKEIKKGTVFSDYPTLKDNNGQVQITALAGKDGKALSGEIVLAELKFEIIDSGATKLTVAYEDGATSESNVAVHGTGKDSLTQVAGGSYTVNATAEKLRAAQARKAGRSFVPILIFIIVLILIGVGIWYYRRKKKKEEEYFVPEAFPLDEVPKSEEQPSSDGVSPPSS